ncbi:hypothetical protein F4560_002926 [Saccharothrix ecbatanensis]|uniref:SUKH-4 immunity protein of toxin-antitoxin system n=1 Tax=Saccharothrix ecbatanensis TaxID=1105145 RepID=A0A7W9M0T7_9PSEU|nr:SUKH-4 family immunity protein [Saccharothrix ecbatanensis]MBB5803158.1 hypothetical protein [Saccharothrix ecbatanensis]
MFAVDSDLVERARSAWGERLRPVPPDAPHPALPPALREFVESVGLPTDNPWHARFHDLPPQPPVRSGGREFAVLGSDHGVPIVVDVIAGSVWRAQSGAPCLINSSLPLFLHALGRLDQLYRGFGDAPPSERLRRVEDLRAELADLDPPSLAPSTAWQGYFDAATSE